MAVGLVEPDIRPPVTCPLLWSVVVRRLPVLAVVVGQLLLDSDRIAAVADRLVVVPLVDVEVVVVVVVRLLGPMNQVASETAAVADTEAVVVAEFAAVAASYQEQA